jgi:3-deoxy-D-manno-octulosonate 8-phosphate phosphatase KdsC-like HAD superfamily phosphatase
MTKPLFVCDVDGVLTDGRVLYIPDIVPPQLHSDGYIRARQFDGYITARQFNVRDGHALQMSREYFGTVFMSGEDDDCIRARIQKIKGIFFGGIDNKLEKAELLLQTNDRVYNGRLIAMSDDVMDIPLLKRADVAFCPADAELAVRRTVKAHSHGFVVKRNGGEGAYRAAVNILIGSRALARLLREEV